MRLVYADIARIRRGTRGLENTDPFGLRDVRDNTA